MIGMLNVRDQAADVVTANRAVAPRRILYLHQYFATPDNHGGTRSYEMARRLVERGHEVEMVTAWPDKDRQGDWFRTCESGINVHWIPVPYSNHLSYPERMRAFFRFAQKAALKAAAIPADLIFATSTPLTIALPAVYAAQRRRIPMVFEVRDLWPTMPIAVGALRNPVAIRAARWMERFAYRNAEHVVALSPGMRDGIVAAGCAEECVSVIPNSCDNGLFSSISEEEARRWLFQRYPELVGGPLIGYTGTIGRINAVQYMVEMAACALQRGSPLRFAVFGEGAEEENVARLACERGVLGKNFWLYRPIPKKDMPFVVRSLNLATSLFKDVPEMRHNSANKFFDALAAARPVLINYCGWQAEILDRSGAGLVAPPTAPGVALELAEQLLGSEERWADASRAAERLAQEHFDRDLLAARLADLLGQVYATWQAKRAINRTASA